jgi:hypothetical protein
MRKPNVKNDSVDSWLQEKSVIALQRLTRISALLRDRDRLTRDDLLYLEYELHSATAYTATIVSASVGSNNGPFGGDVASRIARDPENALDDFLYELGIIEETKAMTRKREICELIHLIMPHLDGPRGEHRTMICSFLATDRSRSPLIDELWKLTEEVTDGLLDWSEYCRRIRPLVDMHDCVAKGKAE